MSKKIVIVESDTAFSKKLKDELAKNGFTVIETGDGKGAFDLCRREKPDMVVLAVELSAGQSGYLVCGKLKKDDDLKKTPVIIIGKDPEGFEGHKKLKTRAEEYLKKPFAPEALTVKVGVLIGLPNDKKGEEILVDDESLGITALDPLPSTPPVAGKADGTALDDMFDQAFDSSLGTEDEERTVVHQAIPGLMGTPVDDNALSGLDLNGDISTPADILPGETSHENGIKATDADADSALSVLGVEEIHSDLDVIEIEETNPKVESAPSIKSAARPRTVAPVFNDAELQQLRAKVTELDDKISNLENQLAEKDSELAAAKAASGGAKDASALKEQLLKKDKEILKLKQELNEKAKELNEKESELVEVKEKEAAFDSKLTEKDSDIAKRDAQLKSLQQKVDALSSEKKKVDAALTSAKDEARAAAASLATVQGELDQHQDHIAELSKDLENHKAKVAEHSQAADAARAETAELRSSLQGEIDALKSELERVQSELTTVRETADSQQKQSEEEISQQRARIAELEQANTKNEDRVVKAYQKIKGDEKLREKTRKAISVALQLLDENTGANVVDETDLRT
jgi:CheY-like chemotaxis protein